MKKFLLAAAAAFMLALPSQAQVKFGLRGGLNINNFSMSSKVLDSSNKTGFYVGPTMLITLPIVDIDASVLYDQRDLSVSTDESATSTTIESNTIHKKSIDLQANIRKGFGLGSTASIFFFAGPQVAFNVGNKDANLYDNVKAWTWKSADFSINLGIGAMVLNHLEAKVNYNIACGKCGDQTSAAETAKNVIGDIAPKANAWQIGLAYYF